MNEMQTICNQIFCYETFYVFVWKYSWFQQNNTTRKTFLELNAKWEYATAALFP